jgi:hypothetical protein
MICDLCDKIATSHVTERVAGKVVRKHRCEAHVDADAPPQQSDPLTSALREQPPAGFPMQSLMTLREDSQIRAAIQNDLAVQKLTAFLLPRTTWRFRMNGRRFGSPRSSRSRGSTSG